MSFCKEQGGVEKRGKVSAVIVAGGQGKRMGAAVNKVFLQLDGKEVLAHTVTAFEQNPEVSEIIVVLQKCDQARMTALVSQCGFSKVLAIVEGGRSRQESVYKGLQAAHGELVLIHDGARALVGQQSIRQVIMDCRAHKAAAVGVPCKDTLKQVTTDGFIEKTLDRDQIYQIQTPQAFYLEDILEYHQKALAEGTEVTDDCALAELYGGRVFITRGSYENLKLTTPEDLEIARRILERRGKAK